MENIKEILKEAGGKVSDIVKVTVYFTDIKEYANMNNAYIKFFKENGVETNFPARSCVEVGPLMYSEWHVEIDATAKI